MKSRLFKIAHSIKANFETFAAALKHAWLVIKLMRKLNSQAAVMFKYKKVEGPVREAVGTIAAAPGHGNPLAPKFDVLRYYDVICDGWRSCKISHILFN